MFVALLLVSMIVVAGCGSGDSGSGVSGTCAADKVWNGAACVTLESAVAPIMLAKTGQTFCAGDLSGATISCDGIAPDYFDSIYTHYPGSAWPVVDKIFTGQDTALFSGKAWPTPRFVADKDRTVFDKVTGLVWSRNANPAGTAQNWQGALDYVKSLNSSSYMGRNDWRLPNINELRSLTSAQEFNISAWLSAQGFTDVENYYYWASTSFTYNPSYGWFVNMGTGNANYNSKGHYFYVWPVSGGQSVLKTGQTKCYDASGNSLTCNTTTGEDGDLHKGVTWPTARFTINASDKNLTIYDNLTALIWTQDANLIKSRDSALASDGRVVWRNALAYIKKLNDEKYAGYSDWRLPNREELASLVHYGVANTAGFAWDTDGLNQLGFQNVVPDYYWSSTTSAFNSYHAWFVSMYGGYVDTNDKVNTYYVWPVRGVVK